MLCSKEEITLIQTNKNANTSTLMHLTFASMNHATILLALEKEEVLLLALQVAHPLDPLPLPLDLQAELEVLLLPQLEHQLQHLAQITTVVNALLV